MKHLIKLQVAVLIISAIAGTGIAHAATAFLKHDYISGTNRICVYDHLGSDFIYTQSGIGLCPLTINI